MKNQENPQGESPETTKEHSVFVTDRAARQINILLEKSGQKASGKGFRISVKIGGCSGLEYDMDLDAGRYGDFAFEKAGARVFIDGETMNYIGGSTLDYVETVKTSGFQIINPNATGSCGCGISFKI